MSSPPLKKVLLVDDQRDIRSIATLSLGKLGGFTLRACASGQEALDCVLEFAPDLLLLDVSMPGMDGMATLDHLRALGVAAPAIFFTARIGPEELARQRSHGAIGLVPKPFDPLKLAHQIKELWARHHEGSQAPR